MNNLAAVSHQISGLVDDNRTQLKPASGQTQRRAGDPGQPKEGTAAHALSPSALRDVVRRGAGRRPVLQGVAGEPRCRASSPSRSSTRRSPTSVLTPTRCCRRNSSTRASASPALPRCRCPSRAPGRAEIPFERCRTRSPATPAIRGAVRPACRCPALPAATRTASPCLRRRPAGRRQDRPRLGPAPGELPPPTIPPPNPAAVEGGPPSNPADTGGGQR